MTFSACLNLTMFPNDKTIEFGIGVGDQAMKKNVSGINKIYLIIFKYQIITRIVYHG